jgi:hypothetical protein
MKKGLGYFWIWFKIKKQQAFRSKRKDLLPNEVLFMNSVNSLHQTGSLSPNITNRGTVE